MKRIILAIVLLSSIALTNISCDKYIQKKKEEAIVNEITKGIWKITKFTEAGTSTVSTFTPWTFKFTGSGTSGTCIATDSTASPIINCAGTWSGDANTQSFTIVFNTTPTDPLPKCAGVWKVTMVLSEGQSRFGKTENGVDYTMELTRQ